jgi:hypothetical protein
MHYEAQENVQLKKKSSRWEIESIADMVYQAKCPK